MEKTECEVATLSEMPQKVLGWSARTTASGDGIVEFTDFRLAPTAARSLTVDEAIAMWD